MTKKLRRMTPIVIVPLSMTKPPPKKKIYFGVGFWARFLEVPNASRYDCPPPMPRNKSCVSPVAAPLPPPSPSIIFFDDMIDNSSSLAAVVAAWRQCGGQRGRIAEEVAALLQRGVSGGSTINNKLWRLRRWKGQR